MSRLPKDVSSLAQREALAVLAVTAGWGCVTWSGWSIGTAACWKKGGKTFTSHWVTCKGLLVLKGCIRAVRMLLLACCCSEVAFGATVGVLKIDIGNQVGSSVFLFQQLQIFGNHQYLIQDVVITLLVCLTSKQHGEARCVCWRA